MKASTPHTDKSQSRSLLTPVIIILTVLILFISWYSMRENKSDSFQLLVAQGEAFIESMTITSENAIAAEDFFDYLLHLRYQELVIELSQQDLENLNDQNLNQIALSHDLNSVFVYNTDSTLAVGTVVRGGNFTLPDYIIDGINQLIATPEENYLLILDQGETPDDVVHYYIEFSNRMDRVIVLVADALFYIEALEQTQIGYLAQRMAREEGIEYILYQTEEGIVFSSRDGAEVLSISSDQFLQNALDGDRIMHREFVFQDKDVLEFVRPFATSTYPYGLLRIGLSLDRFNKIALGYKIQITVVSVVLFILTVSLLLYLNSRQSRKAISAEFDRFRSLSEKIFEEMKIGVAAVDNNGQLIIANDAFYRIGMIAGQKIIDWDELIFANELSFKYISLLPEQTFEKELTIDKKGQQRCLLAAVSKLYNQENQFDGFVTVIYDITELKELQNQAARKERLSEMGDLAAGVAHEIRNPLNSISIAAQRLASEFIPPENPDEFISFTNQIRTETTRLNDIITRFLALTKARPQVKQTININDVIQQFLTLAQPEAETGGISVVFKADEKYNVRVDADGIKQILTNLFNNSKEAFDAKPGKIKISIFKEDSLIKLIYEDSGPGISDELKEKVFTPYFTTKERGTGLGLPTIYRIVSDFGGDIKIENSELGGAKFVITFENI